ncbi:MAG: hypothetical protein AABX11_06865 [Nanoarchaeota archaeon]
MKLLEAKTFTSSGAWDYSYPKRFYLISNDRFRLGAGKSEENLSEHEVVKKLLHHENELDAQHAVVLSLLLEGRFDLASKMFRQMQEVYSPNDEQERENFANPRLNQIENVLSGTQTIAGIYLRGEEIPNNFDSYNLTRQTMIELPSLRKGGRHVLRYAYFNDGRLLLSEY